MFSPFCKYCAYRAQEGQELGSRLAKAFFCGIITIVRLRGGWRAMCVGAVSASVGAAPLFASCVACVYKLYTIHTAYYIT